MNKVKKKQFPGNKARKAAYGPLHPSRFCGFISFITWCNRRTSRRAIFLETFARDFTLNVTTFTAGRNKKKRPLWSSCCSNTFIFLSSAHSMNTTFVRDYSDATFMFLFSQILKFRQLNIIIFKNNRKVSVDKNIIYDGCHDVSKINVKISWLNISI